MSEGANIENEFSAELIRLYLEGKLPAEKMHALEKAALDDPFLADAIEGMQIRLQNTQGSFEDDTQALRLRLQQRIASGRKNKVLPIVMTWRGAAAILILAGSVFLIDRLALHNETKPIAIQTEKKPGPPVSDSSRAIVSSTPEREVAAEPNEAPKKSSGEPVSGHAAQPGNENPGKSKAEIPAPEKKAEAEQETLDKTISANDLAASAPPKPMSDSEHVSPPASLQENLKRRAAGTEIQSAKPNFSPVFRGRVLDQNRRPVAGASVAFQNKKAVTLTDDQGRFRLKADDGDSNSVVVINSAGYQPASHILGSDSMANIVQLKVSSSSLNEVVVAGYNSKKKEDTTEDYVYDPYKPVKEKIRVEKAVPVIGWKEYNKYLDRNKKISTADSTLSGNEIISFIVDSNGGLSSFKIEKSISPAHDAEAIRLIRGGPAWKLLKGKKERTTATIKF